MERASRESQSDFGRFGCVCVLERVVIVCMCVVEQKGRVRWCRVVVAGMADLAAASKGRVLTVQQVQSAEGGRSGSGTGSRVNGWTRLVQGKAGPQGSSGVGWDLPHLHKAS